MKKVLCLSAKQSSNINDIVLQFQKKNEFESVGCQNGRKRPGRSGLLKNFILRNDLAKDILDEASDYESNKE